jgi:hypothetical protein
VADLITTTQYLARTGLVLADINTDQVSALISDASALVVDVVNDTDVTDTWDDTTVPASVVPVVVAMIRRAIDNPNGYRSESIDGYSFTGAATTGLFATRDETRVIRRAVGTSGVGALNLESDLHYPLGTDWWLQGAL